MMGPRTIETWQRDPRKVMISLARYKFVAKMLSGIDLVAEVGCGDGFGSSIVRQEVRNLDCYDLTGGYGERHDITTRPLPHHYDAIYALDVLEHIDPQQDETAWRNIRDSLMPDGVFIAGCPSLESQPYASEISRAGHVNCKSGEAFKSGAQKFFKNVFLFGMNDEVLHTGFAPMCHYLFVLCAGPR